MLKCESEQEKTGDAFCNECGRMSALFNYKLLSLNKILYKSLTSFTLADEYFNPTVLK